MKQNNESQVEQITQEFADSGTLFNLEAKYLSLVTKAIHDSNYTKALPDRMGCRGKAGKIAVELVSRFLNKYGLILTNNTFNDEYSQNLSNRDTGSSLIDIVKLKDETNPLHELVQVMKNTERHQYHHPKLVQALMNKVPHLLNNETKSHFNSILSRATVAKNNREKNSKRPGNSDENLSPINKITQNNKNDSLIANRSVNMNSNINHSNPSSENQITTTIQQPIVFLDEGADNNSSKPQNLLLTLNLNIKSPTNPDEQAILELSPPLPKPSQITATAVLLPEGDDYQKISSSNGTNQLFNEEEENIREHPQQVWQNRDIQNMGNIPNQDQNQYEYEYEYEEVEEEQTPNVESNENTPKNVKEKEKKEKPKKSPKKSPKKQKPSKKSKKKSSIDPQIQQQLEQQQLIIQKLQELNQFQQQQQQEQQQKFQQQLQQQELQQQQLQQLLQEQQLQQEKIQQQLQQEQQLKYSKKDEYEYSSAKSEGSYTNNTALSEEEEEVKEEIKIEQPRTIYSEASMTSVADFINDQTEDVKKREIQSVSNALDNLLKNKNQVIHESDESTIIIPIEKKEKKPQLHIQAFSMPEVPFNENNDYYSDITYENEKNQESDYSNYSNYSNINEKGQNSDYSNYTNYSKANEEESIPEMQTRKILIQQQPEPIPTQQQQPNENASLSAATSASGKEYPETVIKSIKEAFSPHKDKNDSFETTSTQLQQSKPGYSYSPYYTSDYYNDDEEEEVKNDRDRRNDQKQVKFKLRINREQFERFYPNQNLSNTQTIKVSKQGLNQLQQLMAQKNGNEPLRQVIRLRTPTFPPSASPSPFMQPQQQPFQNPPHQHKEQVDPSTISVVTKGPHTGLIKRKIKKSDHQADIQKKLKEKTEYAKKLQEELERRTKEMEQQQQMQQLQLLQQQQQQQAANIQMTNKKLVRSQPQTRTKRSVRDRSPSPKEVERPNSAPKKRGKKVSNYKNRDIYLNNDFETINTSSLIPSTISTVSEVHPELMSPKQREQKKKEIKRKMKKLRDELNLRNDPEEKRIKRAKIEAKLQQLREEFDRSSDQAEREVKRQKINSNLKKLNHLDQSPNFTRPPRNNNVNNEEENIDNMTPAQRRKRRNELKLELQRLYKEFDKSSEEQQSQSNSNNQRPIIPRRNNQGDMEPIPVNQRPKQRDINLKETDSFPAKNDKAEYGSTNYFNPSYENQSDYSISYNSNSNIETEESYSQSPIQKQNNQQPPPPPPQQQKQNNPPPPQLQLPIPIPRNREILDNLNDDDEDDNDDNANKSSGFFTVSESSSLLNRRHLKEMKIEIPAKDLKNRGFNIKNNEQENRRRDDLDINEELDSNNYDENRDNASANSDNVNKQQKYKAPKINIKKKTPTKRRGSNKSQTSEKGEVVEETIVIKDGKTKLKKRIHIPLTHQNNEYDIQSGENYDSKKVTAKSSSNFNQQREKKMDDGLARNEIKNDDNNLTSDYSNLNTQEAYSSFILRVKVVEAKDVPNIDSFDPCDPYCLLFIEGQDEESSRRTKSMERTSDPVWNEKFEFYVNNEKQNKRRRKHSSQSNQNCILNVHIKDEDANAGDVLLSSTKINLLDYQIGKVYDDWFPLQNEASSDDYKSKSKEINRSAKSDGNTTNSSKGTGSNTTKSGGKVHLVFEKIAMLDEGENDNDDENGNKSNSYSASNSYKLNKAKLFENQNGQKIRLNLLIDQAEGLTNRNQFIVAKIKNSREVMKTRPINSSQPIWNESFKLKLPNPQEDILLITLRAKDEKNGDDDIGSVSIPISTLTPPNSGQIVDKWYEFRSTSYASRNKSRSSAILSAAELCGTIHLILSTEFDKDDSTSYSNSVTPNASSNNSAYRGSSSIQRINQNTAMLIKQQVPNSAARHLAVQIVKARGLPSRCSPYCIIQIRNEKPILHTRAVRPTPLPKWNQEIDFYSRKAVEDGILDILIKDKRSNNGQEVASLSLLVEDLNQAKMAVVKDEDNEDENFVINRWFPLEPTGEIHLIIAPRMKDSPKPTILTPIENKDNYDENDDSYKKPGVQIDASSSDIDIDVEFDVNNEKIQNLQKKHRRNRRSSSNANPEIDSHKKKILEQFPPTTSEEE